MKKDDLKNKIKDFVTSQKGLAIITIVLNTVAVFAWLWVVFGMIFAPIHTVKEEIPRLTIDQNAYDAVHLRLQDFAAEYNSPDFASQYPNPEPFNEYGR